MKKTLLALFAALVMPFFVVVSAHADVNDFVINKFDADYTLSKADPQGELKVTETIAVTYSDNNHGILRAIPNDYKKHRLQMHVDKISSSSGAPASYTTYQSGGNTVLKIGDANKTVTGAQEYTIAYTLHNTMSFYPDHDEFYWDINGDQWAQKAERVTMYLHLPDGLGLSRDPICYTGGLGSTNQHCARRETFAPNQVRFTTTQALAPYETLSVVVGVNKGYFQPSTWYETAGEYAASVIRFLVPVVLIGGLALWHWRRFGRDAKGKRVIVPEYEAPDGLKAAEVGTIADFRTDNRDITATIIDLAIRGYIKIIETTKDRKFLKDTKTYSLRLEKDNFDELKSYEARILREIFDSQLQTNQPVGGEVDLAELKYKLSSTVAFVHKNVHGSLVKQGYFGKTPLSASVKFTALLITAYIVCIFLAVFLQGAALIVGIAVATVIAGICLASMPSRTAKGVAAKESILGLKLYLEVAEAERIKKLQSPGAAYAAKSDGPKMTVELFEKLLPYAMVLGVEEQWAKQFEHIYKTPPDWYQGNTSAFSAIYLTSVLSSGVQSSVNTAFSAPSSSSSSGFSGGGSGGGGGGGGGGGW